MYDKPFFISGPVSNNAFSFNKRPGAKLYVAALKDGFLEDVRAGDETVFEDFDETGTLKSCRGLESFVRMDWNGMQGRGDGQGRHGTPGHDDGRERHGTPGHGDGRERHGKPVYIFDNHNHAFAFWHLEISRGLIHKGCTIIHVDQHKDSREPASYLSPADADDTEKVFRYANEVLNVGNFMPAALKTGLAGRIVNIDGESAMAGFEMPWAVGDLSETVHGGSSAGVPDIILDVDLDFFAPELDYIGNENKYAFIKHAAQSAKMITIATSPFFIDHGLAMDCLGRIGRDLGLK